MYQSLAHLFLYWILPFAVSLAILFFSIAYFTDLYEKKDLDRVWHFFMRWGIIIGLFIAVCVFISHQVWWLNLVTYSETVLKNLQNLNVFQRLLIYTTIFINKIDVFFSSFFSKWLPVYVRALLIVGFFGLVVEPLALLNRIRFTRMANITITAFFLFPFLIFKYFFGYQSPLTDYALSRILRAKMRENLNDSYESAVYGVDANGEKFKQGSGGSTRTQTIKMTAIAMRRTKITVRTTADGIREAHIRVLQSRETETDKSIEQVLKGLGERLSGNSIYFPADPIYSSKEKGFVFDSSVEFKADSELGSWRGIFSDPFSEDNKIGNGGEGAIRVFFSIFKMTFNYFYHATPFAIYQRFKTVADQKFHIDTSIERATFRIQQNLDLSLIPTPVDPDTGNDIETQKKRAIRVARARIKDVTMALNSYKISGQLKGVQVGGNVAIYNYVLPQDATLPTDFDKVQKGIANLLRIKADPIITLKAGTLSLSMSNGVNIPVSFAELIKKRKKGVSNIISGLIGVDTIGNPTYFELGDKNPHAMFFGKTGTGKTVSLEVILYSIMSATDPEHLRIAYVDGKGNSFEFMGATSSHPNPFTFAPPADASGDMDYSRAVLIYIEQEVRRRIDLFKKAEVSKLAEYNKKFPDKKLFEILLLVDEFSAITQQDKNLKASELAKKSTEDRFEYIAKMARSVGIRMLLANQSARKELIKGKISANITGRVSLGVTEPIESDIALPETGISLHLISQPGEYYSIMNGSANPEHGNSPYLPDEIMNALNDSLTKKFGECKYVATREEIMKVLEEDDEEEDATVTASASVSSIPVPSPIPTEKTPLNDIMMLDEKYYPWLISNKNVLVNNRITKFGHVKERREASEKIKDMLSKLEDYQSAKAEIESSVTHKSIGDRVKMVAHGSNRGRI